MNIQSSALTDTGRVRRNNEDTFLAEDMLGLYVVADGMGGHAGGETASRLAVESLREMIGRYHAALAGHTGHSPVDARTALQEGFITANRAVFEAGMGDPRLLGMGTTMTALLAEERALHLAHLGDSRAYRMRQGKLLQLTEDHTLVAEQVRAGLLSPQQARGSMYRHIISRAVGVGGEERPDVTTVEAGPGDVFLLCSDGLTEMLTDAVIESILAAAPVPEAARQLVAAALEAGGVDNVTVVVLQIGDL